MLSDQDVRVTRRTTDFVSEWIRHVKNTGQPWKLADDKEVRLLIQERERTLKRGLARLENPRALELWNEEAGTGRLDFRWRVSRQMINDILEGLGHA
jgi:trimethylamine:corrinoid methyltransferase-like protein